MRPIPGLSDWSNAIVESIIGRYPQVESFVLFGSRAKGCYRPGSDIDICVKGPCDYQTQAQIRMDFEDSYLPYCVDVVVYDCLSNPNLKEHIDRVGLPL